MPPFAAFVAALHWAFRVSAEEELGRLATASSNFHHDRLRPGYGTILISLYRFYIVFPSCLRIPISCLVGRLPITYRLYLRSIVDSVPYIYSHMFRFT
jgi:hypothetical protein